MAQQPAHYSLYMFNLLNVNPAYAGLEHSLSITGVYRRQWVGLEGSPTTQSLSAHMPLYIASGGIGINVENDVIGAQRYTGATLSYNYQLTVGDNGILSLGAAGGIVQRALNGARLRTPEGIYNENIFNHQDDLLSQSAETGTLTTFDAGVYFQTERLEAGLAVRNLTAPTLALDNLNLTLARNYYLTFGLNLDLLRDFSVHPSLLVRYDAVELQADFSLIVQYNDNIFGGAAFRGYNSNSLDAASILAGFKLSEKITLAYAYDITLSKLNQVSNGSHEIVFNYNLNKRIGAGRPPRIIYNPRSL